MATLSTYLQKWKLKLSITKTVTTVFHLYNKEARRELNIYLAVLFRTYLFRNKIGQVSYIPSFRYHLESLSKVLTACVGLLRRLAGSKWGSDAKTLRTATLALSTLLLSIVPLSGAAASTIASLTSSYTMPCD